MKSWRTGKGDKLIHDADCRIWCIKICTCGLLHHLILPENENKPYYGVNGNSNDEDQGLHEETIEDIKMYKNEWFRHRGYVPFDDIEKYAEVLGIFGGKEIPCPHCNSPVHFSYPKKDCNDS